MGLLFRLAELLIVLLPLAGVFIAAIKGFSANKRRIERARDATRPVAASRDKPGNQAARWRSLTRTLEEHSRTDARWLDYELDSAKLLDYPLMTDMRDPFTIGFHRAKLRADLLRPAKAEDMLDDPDAAERYLSAVEEYATAFTAAETEAKRRCRSDFSCEEQQRITRAQTLLRVASDAAATPQERRNAYDVARKELDGLIVLPAATHASIERRVFGEIDGGNTPGTPA
jgi:hypothetical protein